MQTYEDIWITLDEKAVLAEMEAAPRQLGGLKEALAAFHQARQAKAAFEVLTPQQSPLPSSQAEAGAVAVAATLGPEVDRLANLPWMNWIVKAGLCQLENYIAYRVSRLVRPKRLFIGEPIIPGGAAAPELEARVVLDLLPGHQTGIRVGGKDLTPKSSLVFLYPLSYSQPSHELNPCASCQKDCALRRKA